MFAFQLSDETQDKLRYVATVPAIVGTFLMALGGEQKGTPAGVAEMSVGAAMIVLSGWMGLVSCQARQRLYEKGGAFYQAALERDRDVEIGAAATFAARH